MKKQKEIKCWIEIHESESDNPTLWSEKPSKREIENAKEFGYNIYPCKVIIEKETEKL